MFRGPGCRSLEPRQAPATEPPPTWSPGALLSPVLPCRRPVSSGSLSDLTSTTNSLLRDGGSVLGGGREARRRQLEGKERAGRWQTLGWGWALAEGLWALGPGWAGN